MCIYSMEKTICYILLHVLCCIGAIFGPMQNPMCTVLLTKEKVSVHDVYSNEKEREEKRREREKERERVKREREREIREGEKREEKLPLCRSTSSKRTCPEGWSTTSRVVR